MASELGIEDYAIIGDCRTGALVSNNGSIDWLCWPRFDSQACFAALLGRPDHGCWTLSPSDPALKVSRVYRGETNVLETVFETSEGSVAIIDFMPPRQSSSSVVRRVEGRGGTCAMAMALTLRFDYGHATPELTPLESGASALCGPNLVVLRTSARLALKDGVIGAAFAITEGDVIDFALSWGASHEAAPQPFDIAASLADTVAFWEAWSARCTYRGRWRSVIAGCVMRP